MKKLLTLTITCYDADQFTTCIETVKQFHTYNKIAYHQYQTIYVINITDDNLGYLCSIWDSVEPTGADLAIRNFVR